MKQNKQPSNQSNSHIKKASNQAISQTATSNKTSNQTRSQTATSNKTNNQARSQTATSNKRSNQAIIQAGTSNKTSNQTTSHTATSNKTSNRATNKTATSNKSNNQTRSQTATSNKTNNRAVSQKATSNSKVGHPRCVHKLNIVQCMYLSNTTLFDGRDIPSVYYIRYNYMFRSLTMAIFRFHMKYLVSSYTRLNMGCIQWGGKRWGGHEISYMSWRLGGVGTWGFCYYMYIWVNNS